ncbi:pilus assembly protein TadG-related protein [Bacillaceae bacterium S4-13-58]
MKWIKKEDGSALAIVALAFMLLLTIAGFVIDGSHLYMEKRSLQKIANAAALSGAQEVTGDLPKVDAIVHKILEEHGEPNILESLKSFPDDRVEVLVKKEVPVIFSKLFGIDTVAIRAEAIASLGVMGKAEGAAPLGIDDSVPLELYREYKLKVDQTDVNTGNFGILALGGSGAATYEDNLRFGYQEELVTGDILETQTGNVAGKTRTAVEEKLLQCPYVPGEEISRDCSRVLLIPTYEPFRIDQNQLKEVKITGFAYFLITAPMDPKDTSITGMFIEKAGKGSYAPDASENGAYAIRLTR